MPVARQPTVRSREMEVTEHDPARTKSRQLRRLGLLDLDDHLGPVVDLFGRLDDPGADGGVLAVVKPAVESGFPLDQDGVTVPRQQFRPHGQQPDAVLVLLDLLRHANDHERLLVLDSVSANDRRNGRKSSINNHPSSISP